jgi:hypothetical protein
MELLFYIVLSAALVAGIITPAQVGPAGVRPGRSRKRALTNSSPLVRVSHRRVGGLWWRGWSDDRCRQHRDHHHHRRNNRCARDHLLHSERIASVASSTGPRLAPRGCLGPPRSSGCRVRAGRCPVAELAVRRRAPVARRRDGLLELAAHGLPRKRGVGIERLMGGRSSQ